MVSTSWSEYPAVAGPPTRTIMASGEAFVTVPEGSMSRPISAIVATALVVCTRMWMLRLWTRNVFPAGITWEVAALLTVPAPVTFTILPETYSVSLVNPEIAPKLVPDR